MSEKSRAERTRAPLRRFHEAFPLVLAVLIRITAGIGGYTFRYAKGLSYFKTDPRACANCHIMQPEYDAWKASSHHTVAVCIDCHLPHEFMPKYLVKAENGWRHGEKFTTQDFVEPIVVAGAGARDPAGKLPALPWRAGSRNRRREPRDSGRAPLHSLPFPGWVTARGRASAARSRSKS